MAGNSNSRGGISQGAGPRPEGPQQPARLVGRIVDPAVREDGRGEPEMSSTPSHGTPDARSAESKGARHPVRDRLLARAARASSGQYRAMPDTDSEEPSTEPSRKLSGVQELGQSPRGQVSGPGAEQDFFPQPRALASSSERLDSLPELTDDLDTIGLSEREQERREPEPAEQLSNPWLRNVFVGVAVFALLFSALSQGAPRRPLGAALRESMGEGRTAQPATVLPVEENEVGQSPAAASGRQSKRAPGQKQRTASSGSELVREEGDVRQGRAADEAEVESEHAAAKAQPLPSAHPVTRVRRGPWRIEWVEGDPRLRVLRRKVGKDSLLTSLQRAGIGLSEGFRIVKAFEGVRNFDRCRPRDEYLALVDVESGRLKAFEYIVSDEEIYQAREGDDGLLRGEVLDLQVKRRRAGGVIVLDGDFDASARRAGFESGLESRVNKALAGYTSVARMKAGEVLALIAQEVTVLGDFYRYAGVEALEYRRVGADPVRVYYQDVGKTRGYVDTDGRMFGKGRWAKPVRGAPRTSRFNPRRLHPILKVIRPHNGTDYGAPTGTPVMAAADGRVTYAGKMGPNGNFVRLTHAGGYETGYSHLSRFARGLKRGARVSQHQVIGYVGTTGRSTGPHLHFSAKKRGKFIDPESLDLDAFAKLPVSDRRQLQRLRKRYDELLAELKIPNATVVKPSATRIASSESAASRRSVLAALQPSQAKSMEAVLPVTLPIYLTDVELLAALPPSLPDVHTVDQTD